LCLTFLGTVLPNSPFLGLEHAKPWEATGTGTVLQGGTSTGTETATEREMATETDLAPPIADVPHHLGRGEKEAHLFYVVVESL
jgi:hypothetical protein